MTARYSGTSDFTFVLSKITECALSPSEAGPVIGQLAGDRLARDVHGAQLGAGGVREQFA